MPNLASKIVKILPVAFIALAIITPPVKAATVPVAVTDGNGILLGFNNITIGSEVYNVTFCDGTFDTCIGTLDFTAVDDAINAANSLLSAINNSIYFESPSLTYGTTDYWGSSIWTPYMVSTTSVSYAAAQNYALTSVDRVFNFSQPISFDTKQLTTAVYADWTLAAVPIPPAVWLMGSGLVALFGFSRKNVKCRIS